MKHVRMFSTVLAAGVPGAAWAQAPAAPAPPPPGAGATTGFETLVTVGLIVLVLLVVVGGGVKLFDLKRKRDAEAVHLQAQISDALLREQSLFGLAITPTAHVPFWSGTPATVEVSGQVSSEAERQAARQLVERETARIRPDVDIVDRISVAPPARTRVA